MLRFAKALALVLALGASVRAEVVISGGAAGTTGASTDTSFDVYDGTNSVGQYAGFSFTPLTNSSAGNWALSNLKFNLFANSAGTNLDNYTVRLFEITAPNTLSSQLYSKSSGTVVSGAISNSGTGSEFSLNLLGGSGTNSFEINKNYYMSFDFTFTGGSAVTLLGLANSATYLTTNWDPTDSYEAGSDPFSLGVASNSTSIAYSLEAVAVPEPGTLLLGGIAAMGGAGGWWARRRKKAAAADAVAEGEQAATV